MRGMTALAGIPNEKIPAHIAVIMDGNGRWAVQRGLERSRGHQQGAKAVKAVVTECAELRRKHGKPDYLTLYSFSLENWKRPLSEVSFLMEMYIDYLRCERQTMMEQNIRFRQIGRLDQLPPPHGRGAGDRGGSGGRDAQAGADQRGDAFAAAVHGGDAGSGFADSDGGGNAGEQLSPVADQLCGVGGQPGAVAGFWDPGFARSDRGVFAA
jgi:hypothetical protein